MDHEHFTVHSQPKSDPPIGHRNRITALKGFRNFPKGLLAHKASGQNKYMNRNQVAYTDIGLPYLTAENAYRFLKSFAIVAKEVESLCYTSISGMLCQTHLSLSESH